MWVYTSVSLHEGQEDLEFDRTRNISQSGRRKRKKAFELCCAPSFLSLLDELP